MSLNRKYVRRQLHNALANSLAFDSAEREGEDNPIAEFIELLRDKVDAHTLRAVIEILQRESPGAVAAEDDAISNPSGVRGCKTGGAMQSGSEFAARRVAEDTAAYLRRFPNADRVQTQQFGVQPPAKPVKLMTPAQREEFAKRFPNSSRLV